MGESLGELVEVYPGDHPVRLIGCGGKRAAQDIVTIRSLLLGIPDGALWKVGLAACAGALTKKALREFVVLAFFVDDPVSKAVDGEEAVARGS